MRDYGAVSPQFWIGQTGKSLRGNLPAQVVALYLMTSPHANMIGVFYCPLDYIAKETGLPLEGAREALRSLIEAQFCSFDEQTEEVFVQRMAAFQIGESLDHKDNRCKGVAKELEKVSSASLRNGFRATYSVAFHLPAESKTGKPLKSPSKAPPKPETGTEAETEDKSSGGRFEEFWLAWPKSDRKHDKKACREKWIRHELDAVADVILADVKAKRGTRKWRDGFIEAPEVYLNNRRWEDGATGPTVAGDWFMAAGFDNAYEANNSGCFEHNARQFRDGKRVGEPA
jgi:hypothetical protein